MHREIKEAKIHESQIKTNNSNTVVLLLIDRAIRRNWVMLDSLVEKYRMTQ